MKADVEEYLGTYSNFDVFDCLSFLRLYESCFMEVVVAFWHSSRFFKASQILFKMVHFYVGSNVVL